MLSREHTAHRVAIEPRTPKPSRPAQSAGNAALLAGAVWAKLALLASLVCLFGTFLFLNRDAVIEPRLHLVFASYDRPSVLVVMLLTSVATAAGAVLLRTILHALRRLRRLEALPSVVAPAHAIVGMSEPVAAGPSL